MEQEQKIKNVIESVLEVKINASARTRHNSLAKKIFVFICTNELQTPYAYIADMMGRNRCLVHSYKNQFLDINYDKQLLHYYNKCLNKYHECR